MRRLQAMLSAGIVTAGDTIVFEIKSSRYTATLAPDGSLIHKTPSITSEPTQTEVYRSPSEWALEMAKRHNLKRNPRARIRGKITVNGWEECFIAGRSLQELRSAMMRDSKASTSSRDSGAVSSPQKRITSSPSPDDTMKRLRDVSPDMLQSSSNEEEDAEPHGIDLRSRLSDTGSKSNPTRVSEDEPANTLNRGQELAVGKHEQSGFPVQVSESKNNESEDVVMEDVESRPEGKDIGRETEKAELSFGKAEESKTMIKSMEQDAGNTRGSTNVFQDQHRPDKRDAANTTQVSSSSTLKPRAASESSIVDNETNASLKTASKLETLPGGKSNLPEKPQLSESKSGDAPAETSRTECTAFGENPAETPLAGLSMQSACVGVEIKESPATIDTDPEKHELISGASASGVVAECSSPMSTKDTEEIAKRQDSRKTHEKTAHRTSSLEQQDIQAENEQENNSTKVQYASNIGIEVASRSVPSISSNDQSAMAGAQASDAQNGHSIHDSHDGVGRTLAVNSVDYKSRLPQEAENDDKEERKARNASRSVDDLNANEISTSCFPKVPYPEEGEISAEAAMSLAPKSETGLHGNEDASSTVTARGSLKECSDTNPGSKSNSEQFSAQDPHDQSTSNMGKSATARTIYNEEDDSKVDLSARDDGSSSPVDAKDANSASNPSDYNARETRKNSSSPPTMPSVTDSAEVPKRSEAGVKDVDNGQHDQVDAKAWVVENAEYPHKSSDATKPGFTSSCPRVHAQEPENDTRPENVPSQVVSLAPKLAPEQNAHEGSGGDKQPSKAEGDCSKDTKSRSAKGEVSQSAGFRSAGSVSFSSASKTTSSALDRKSQNQSNVKPETLQEDNDGRLLTEQRDSESPSNLPDLSSESIGSDGEKSKPLSQMNRSVEKQGNAKKERRAVPSTVSPEAGRVHEDSNSSHSAKGFDGSQDRPARSQEFHAEDRYESSSDSRSGSHSARDEGHSASSSSTSNAPISTSKRQVEKGDHSDEIASQTEPDDQQAVLGRKRARDISPEQLEDMKGSKKPRLVDAEGSSKSSEEHDNDASSKDLAQKPTSDTMDEDADGDDEMDERLTSSRRRRVQPRPRDYNGDVLSKSGYLEGILDDPAAVEAATIAAAAEKEEAVYRARRTTRLAAGKIKQVDYKVSAALSSSRPASLSGNEVDASDDDGGNILGDSKRSAKRQRAAQRPSRTPARDRPHRSRSTYDEKDDDSVSDVTTNNSRQKPRLHQSSSSTSRDPPDHDSSSNGSRKDMSDDGQDGDDDGRSGDSSDDGRSAGELTRENSIRSQGSLDNEEGANSTGSAEHGSIDGVSSDNQEDALFENNDGIVGVHDDDVEGAVAQDVSFRSSRRRSLAKPTSSSNTEDLMELDHDDDDDDDNDVDVDVDVDDAVESDNKDLNSAEDDSEPRDEDGWSIPELSAIALAVKSTGSLDASAVYSEVSKGDGGWPSHARSQDDVSRYLKSVTDCLLEFCPRNSSSTTGENGVRTNDLLSFIAAEVCRLGSGTHRPASAIVKQIHKESRRRVALEKARRKSKRDLEDARAKLETEMDIRRKLNLESSYHQIRIGDCTRAYEREKEKRLKTEVDIEKFVAREADVRDRTEKIKLLASQLRNDGTIDNGILDEKIGGSDMAGKGAKADQLVSDKGGEVGSMTGTAPGGLTSKTKMSIGTDGESGTSGEVGKLAESRGGDTSMASDGPENGFKRVHGVRRLKAMIATYQAEAERSQRECERERFCVNQLLDGKNKLEQEYYLHRTNWSLSLSGRGLLPGGVLGKPSREVGGRRLDSSGRGLVRNTAGVVRARGPRGMSPSQANPADISQVKVIGGATVGAGRASATGTEKDVASAKKGPDVAKQPSRRKGLPVRSPHS